MLTEKDKQLIARAQTLSYLDWDIAFRLAREAESEEARQQLRLIGSTLYHTEEYYADIL